jgi:chemotaxis protein methyltransferase CheR
MQAEPRSSLEDDFGFNDADFAWVCDRALRWAGLQLTPTKRSLVHNRLVRRLRALNLSSFMAYRKVVEDDAVERQAFINALTTHVTSFFREAHHFDVLSKIAARATGGLKVWSAACSSGEEPYTIAAVLAEHLPSAARANSSVLATDIDTDVIRTGTQGVYPLDAVEAIDEPYRRHFERGLGKNSGSARAKSHLRQLIAFHQLNLFEPWPNTMSNLDVVFCRNALIYFDRDRQEGLVRRFVDALKVGGTLFLGHSESPPASEERIRPSNRTTFTKVSS